MERGLPTNSIFMYRLTKVRTHTVLLSISTPVDLPGGDKAGDAEMLEWLCSKGYVAAGVNYTLFTEENPDARVYSQ